MSRDYETPEDYAWPPEHDTYDDYIERDREDRAEAALRRWEEQREMPNEDEPEPEDTIAHAAWLRREEYGDQDREAA
jgi:ubiquitin